MKLNNVVANVAEHLVMFVGEDTKKRTVTFATKYITTYYEGDYTIVLGETFGVYCMLRTYRKGNSVFSKTQRKVSTDRLYYVYDDVDLATPVKVIGIFPNGTRLIREFNIVTNTFDDVYDVVHKTKLYKSSTRRITYQCETSQQCAGVVRAFGYSFKEFNSLMDMLRSKGLARSKCMMRTDNYNCWFEIHFVGHSRFLGYNKFASLERVWKTLTGGQVKRIGNRIVLSKHLWTTRHSIFKEL